MTRRIHLALLASASFYLAALPCAAQPSPPETGIKADRPPPGSLIRREAVRGSRIPINRTYQELTPQERAIVHGWYERIAQDDEPPFPLEGMRPIHDAMRRGQGKLLITGDLLLIATVEPSGEVSAVQAVGSPSREMTRFASSVLMLTKFKPAVCAGTPCRMDFPVWYSFRVESR